MRSSVIGGPRLSRRSALRVLGLLGCGGWLAGCGYRLQGAGGSPAIRLLHVGAFSNGTFKAGLDGAAGAAVLRALRLDGRVRLVEEPAAEAVLTGRVTAYENDAITFDPSDIGRRFRVRVTMLVTVTDRRSPAEGFKEQISAEAFYTTGADVVQTRAAEDDAAARAVQELATRVLARLTEDF